MDMSDKITVKVFLLYFPNKQTFKMILNFYLSKKKKKKDDLKFYMMP